MRPLDHLCTYFETAIALANARARLSGIRQEVKQIPNASGWTVRSKS